MENIDPNLHQEALVDNAVRDIELFSEKRRQDLADTYEAHDMLLQPISEQAVAAFSNRRKTLAEAIARIPVGREMAIELARRYQITDQLDQEAVDNLIYHVELYGVARRDNPEAVDSEQESIDFLREDLRIREAKRAYEKAGETELVFDISGNRTLKFYIDEAGEKGRIELPLVKDPSKERVATGPNAVIEILGAPLEVEDYRQIAKSLLTLPDKIGEACRTYYDACKILASASVVRGNSDPELDRMYSRREGAAVELVMAFDSKDPYKSPYSDIPLHALFVDAVHDFNLSGYQVPQPFQS